MEAQTRYTPRWATPTEAAEHLRITTATLRRLSDAGKITRNGSGKLVRYDLDELDAHQSAAPLDLSADAFRVWAGRLCDRLTPDQKESLRDCLRTTAYGLRKP
jgi:excisionase family DNA binding protein